MKQLRFLLACCLLLAACHKKEDVTVVAYDQAIIGKHYGFSGLTKYFLVNAEGVFPRKGFVQNTATYDSVSLPAAKQAIARDIINGVPAYLFSHPNTRFTCPSCADQQSLYLELHRNGTVTTWTIDLEDDYIPEELKPFAHHMSESMDQL